MFEEIQKLAQEYINQSSNPWGIFSKRTIAKQEREFIRNTLKGCDKILDCCGGDGLYSSLLPDSSQRIVLDQSEKMLNHGRDLYPKIEFIEGSVLDMPFPDQCFDGILVRANLMYFNPEERVRYIKEIYRVLKPKGTVCLIERNKDDFLFKYLPPHVRVDPFEKPKDFLNLSSACDLLSSHGFQVQSCRGFRFSLPHPKNLLDPRRKFLADRFIPLQVNGLSKWFPKNSRWIFLTATK